MLRPWRLTIILDRSARTSVGQQIAHAIIEEIRRGRLERGTALPGTRDLAGMLGVNRKTVVLAYAELEAQGWLSSEPRRGTFVANNLPLLDRGGDPRRDRSAIASKLNFPMLERFPDLHADLPAGDMLAFDDGAPDTRLIPIELLARAYRDGLRTNLQRRRLGYGDPRGSDVLRGTLSAMLNAERGLGSDADNLCLTRGSQMAIFAVAQALIAPNDVVVIEALSYPPAREAFRRAGAAIESVGVDAHGLCVDELETLCRQRRVRAVYVTPHHHFPTTVSMTPERRMRLLLLAAQFDFAIVEDDYDHEFHFTHQPMLPLAAFDGGRHVVYIGSLSKLLSPSLRLGYVSGPKPLIAAIAREIMVIDRQGDPATEHAAAAFINAGELKRHTRKMRRLYEQRRQCFAHCLDAVLGNRVAMSVPSGGLAFWVQFDGVNIDRLVALCRERGLHIQSPKAFATRNVAVQALRLGFASLDPDELEIATGRLGNAFDALTR